MGVFKQSEDDSLSFKCGRLMGWILNRLRTLPVMTFNLQIYPDLYPHPHWVYAVVTCYMVYSMYLWNILNPSVNDGNKLGQFRTIWICNKRTLLGISAPAHEHHVIALHRHGHHYGGLPTLFWVSIGILIFIFHLFLFKLIFNEYCNYGDNKYRSGRYNL